MRRHRREENRRDGLGGQRERECGRGERHLMNCMPVHKEKKKKERRRRRGGGLQNTFHAHFAGAQSGSTQSSSLEEDQGCSHSSS